MNDPMQRLNDIIVRCGEAAKLVERGRDTFENDVLLRHAARSIVADIGEAAKNLDDLTNAIPTVPWNQIARMRDRVMHRYFDVDYTVVWDTLEFDLPNLANAIREFLDTTGRKAK